MIALLGKDGFSSVTGMLELAKCTCFGLYLVLEDLTMVGYSLSCPMNDTDHKFQLHAMGVYAVSWNDQVMDQANTFWLYALAFSIAGGVWTLLVGPTQQAPKKNGKKNEKATPDKATVQAAASTQLKRIVVDGCDLLIPLELLGWMPTGDVVVGSTMVLSTLLTAQDIWAQV